MQETKDTSLFTEITAEESASVNGACHYHRHHHRYRYESNGYSPYFDGRPAYGYVSNVSRRRCYYYDR
ncbi:MAG: hypothetical protein WCD53_00430 [Microcoleus sp.]